MKMAKRNLIYVAHSNGVKGVDLNLNLNLNLNRPIISDNKYE
ncbi:hypothetical protein Lalb_Chr03g0043061 [Lupinus albus]|uniref:Uncharacterized protein n=1 Tax=Lupinus albus TaxID=3870 RepID=A0A6A4QTJ5_LUPAL|nr:hypothetical protein Lalb_Chr03g0043061 [Lupinus albus]